MLRMKRSARYLRRKRKQEYINPYDVLGECYYLAELDYQWKDGDYCIVWLFESELSTYGISNFLKEQAS